MTVSYSTCNRNYIGTCTEPRTATILIIPGCW